MPPSVVRPTADRPLAASPASGRRARVAVWFVAAWLPIMAVVPADAQGRGDRFFPGDVRWWIALDATPGRERAATDRIVDAFPVFRRDRFGNLVARKGSGPPRRVVACGLDQVGYVVSQITDDGYLRLHGSGNGRRHPLWDQFHEGQRIRVATLKGPVPGVVAVRSTHLWRRRQADSAIAGAEGAWVDVGARSRDEVAALGIAVLDPVSRDWPAWQFGAGLSAGPDHLDRGGCRDIALAAQAGPARGETVYIISVQSRFDWAGLGAALTALGRADSLTILDAELARGGGAAGTATTAPADGVIRREHVTLAAMPRGVTVGTVTAISAPALFAGTLVEAAGRPPAAWTDAVALATGAAPAPAAAQPEFVMTSPELDSTVIRGALPRPAVDSLSVTAALLTRLTNAYGASGHEEPVRAAVLAELPAWARAAAATDTAGNVVIAVGPDRDTVLIVAHLDEIGFEITKIAPDGVVSLRTRGGFFSSLWEGQPALLHMDRQLGGAGCILAAEGTPSRIRGVFVPRQAATVKQPPELTAWFGGDSAALAACGVSPGLSITGVKRATRLGATRFTNRSIDDRAGCTALILAMRTLDPAKLDRKVIFAFSVREETGLDGAAVLAARFGGSLRRVHAVDTFVSADSPLESPRFALAPIGAGAVVRALDNSSATPPDEVERVVRIAKAAGIPLQVGTTNGGNDGSVFARYGVVDVPLAWPLRYSHSPAELIDLVDVWSLGKLVAAVAVAK